MVFAIYMSLFLLVYVIGRAFLQRDFFQPLVLFVVPVVTGLFLYHVYFQNRWSMSDEALNIYCVGLISFVMGCTAYQLIGKTQLNSLNKTNISTLTTVKFVPWVTYVIGMWLTISSIKYLRGLGEIGLELREYFVTNPDDFPFSVTYGKYFLIFSGVFFLAQSFEDRWRVSRVVGASSAFIMAVALSMFTQARTDVMVATIPLLTVISICKIRHKKISQSIIYGGVIFVAGYAISKVLAIIQESRFETTNTEFFSANNQLFQYVGLPIVAFDEWIVSQGHSGVMNGWGVVEIVDKLGRMAGVVTPKISVAPMGSFNVYSYLKDPYLSWGIGGVCLILMLAGFLASFIYYRAYAYRSFAMIFYCVFANSIFMSFFSWQMANMVNVYAAMFVGLIWLESKLRRMEE